MLVRLLKTDNVLSIMEAVERYCGQVVARVAGAVRNGRPSTRTRRTVGKFAGAKSAI